MSEKTLKLNLIERFKAFVLADDAEQTKMEDDPKSYALKDEPSVAIVVDANGNVSFSDGREVVDGEYPLDGGLVCVITDGKAEIKEVEVKKQVQPAEPPLDATKQFASINSMLCEQIAKVKEMFADLSAYNIYPTWDGVFVGIDAVGNLWWSDGRTMTNYLLPISYDKAIQIDEFGNGKLIDIVDPYCLRSDVGNAKNANAELANQIADLTKQSEDFAVVKAEMEKQIADLTKENADLKSQLPSKVGDFVINEPKKGEDTKEPKKANWDFYAKK